MQVLVRLTPELYRELEKIAESLGVSKAEVLRQALKDYLTRKKAGKNTSKMRGLVKPKLSLDELERLYQVEGH